MGRLRECWSSACAAQLDVVLQRERERQDRTLGQAEAQFAVVHRWADRYDVEVDTSVLTPDEAVARIASALAIGPTTDRR